MSDTIRRVLEQFGRGPRNGLDDLTKVIVVPRRQIWLWIPKNAGGSICRSLFETYGLGAIATDMPFAEIYGLNPALRDFEVVAFQRNPYTRIVSCWLNKVAEPGELVEKYPSLRGLSFLEFAQWLNTTDGGDENADPHWRSQRDFFVGVHRRLKFEDLPGAVEALGLNVVSLPHRNSHRKMAKRIGIKSRPLIDWYDRDSFAAITERYASDLTWLKYEFPGEIPAAKAPLDAADAEGSADGMHAEPSGDEGGSEGDDERALVQAPH